MRTRRPVRLAAALLALLATTACVGLPDTGPVVPAGDEVRTQPDADVERRAQPPQEGQPPQVVVTAFLQAMTAYPVRTEVARQFLTNDAAGGLGPARGSSSTRAGQHHGQRGGQGRPPRHALGRQPRYLARAARLPATSG